MFLDKVELKPFDQLREEGCGIEIIKGEGGNADVTLIRTKDPSGCPVTFAINSTEGKPCAIYVRPEDEAFIIKKPTYEAFKHLFVGRKVKG